KPPPCHTLSCLATRRACGHACRMSRRSATRRSTRRKRPRRAPRFRVPRVWPGRRVRRRWMRTFRRAPLAFRVTAVSVALVALWFGVNWVYQVARKPTELFFPVSGVLYKTPAQTWSQYGVLFRKHSTDLIEPELLAALAQVEGSGNPLVRTYWRWTSSANPFEIFRPASSAVGMYQITDGTFREAKRYCVHDHVVVEDGPWHDWRSCWFNALYSRVIPSHAIEMTSAYLDRRV